MKNFVGFLGFVRKTRLFAFEIYWTLEKRDKNQIVFKSVLNQKWASIPLYYPLFLNIFDSNYKQKMANIN